MIKKDEKVIASRIVSCDSIFSKAFGLRFKWLKKDSAFVFCFDTSQKVLMDMWFVFYPIDVIFLDSKGVIVELKKRFLPFAFYSSKRESVTIIELCNGSIDNFSLNVGDRLVINS